MTGTTSYPLTDAALQCDECCPNCADFAHKLELALAEAVAELAEANAALENRRDRVQVLVAQCDSLNRENHELTADLDSLRADLEKALVRLVMAKGEA